MPNPPLRASVAQVQALQSRIETLEAALDQAQKRAATFSAALSSSAPPAKGVYLSLDYAGALSLQLPPSAPGKSASSILIPEDFRGMQILLRILRAREHTSSPVFNSHAAPSSSLIRDWIAARPEQFNKLSPGEIEI